MKKVGANVMIYRHSKLSGDFAVDFVNHGLCMVTSLYLTTNR